MRKIIIIEETKQLLKQQFLFLRKQNSCLSNNYYFADANKKILWKQKSWGSKNKYFEDAKINIVRVQEQKKTHYLMIPMLFCIF